MTTEHLKNSTPTDKKTISNRIVELTKIIHLPGIRSSFKEEANYARESGDSYETYLNSVLENELNKRQHNRMLARIRLAKFPVKYYLDSLTLEKLPEDAQKRLETLKTLEFIENKQNIIFAGNPGTGKTHIATGLGISACCHGFKVLFISVPSFVTQLKEMQSQKSLRRMELMFEKYDLVICDEFGYISFDKAGAELFFTLLSLRTGKKSTIITTNLYFERWNEIFNDPVLTAAMVDRLTHKAYVINMNGKSFRLQETKEWIKKMN